MRGPKPKPTYLKLIMGNPGKRRLGKDIDVAPVMPDPPEFLPGEAKEEWRRVVPLLSGLRLLTALDVSTLAAYCCSFAIWKQATAALREQELTTKTVKGTAMRNILIGVARNSASDMVRYGAEFGLTPSARGRLTGGIQPHPSKFDGLIGAWKHDDD